jgi:chaperone protein EcpD
MDLGTFKAACFLFATVAGPAVAAGDAIAGVVVDGTRVVFRSDKREVSVSLRNVGDTPSLVQAWIDGGDAKVRPGDTSVPFVLSPPLFRLDPAKGQTLRLIYTEHPLAADREVVFWLNVLDIPPRSGASADGSNRLEMAFRHRLKLFLRPASLRGDTVAAAVAVTWSIARREGRELLVANNPSPFYVSITDAAVSAGAETVGAQTEMLPPFASRQFSLVKADVRLSSPMIVKYSFINDFGAVVHGEAPVGFAP